jgi:DNA replication protein DnaC
MTLTNSSLDRTCPICGENIPPIEIELPWKTMMVPGRCECEKEEARKQEELEERRQKRIRIERLFNISMLGPRFAECTFDNWKHRPGSEKAYEASIDYVKNWHEKRKTGEGLIMYGSPGNGKSHLGAAIANSLLATENTVIFANVPNLLLRIQATFGASKKETQSEIMNVLQLADLLILDDAGAEKWSSWVETTLYSIINSRYMARLPVIITSNLGISELKDAVGYRTFDRLIETCPIIENTASSYRVEIASQRAKKIKKTTKGA